MVKLRRHGQLVGVLIVCLVILLLVVAHPARGRSRTEVRDTDGPVTAAADPTLSTPELIEQAYQDGRLTAEQRLLYLAYALYDAESLPKAYHSNVLWFGTAYVAEIEEALAARQSGRLPPFSAETAAAFAQLAPDEITVCGQEDGPNNHDSANFHINYDIIRVDLTVNDYANALETSYKTEVTDYGWARPPFCTAGVGTCAHTNPWNHYPVQIAELSFGLVGYVSNSHGRYTGRVGDNLNTTATETDSYASCMVLTNDFSANFSPGTALQKLNTAAAHEFNHAIQQGYTGSGLDRMWRESGATYMEDEVFDDINGHYSRLWPTFTSCMGEYDDGGFSYSNWLFLRYAAEHNGGTNRSGGGEDIMQTFWETLVF